MTRYTTPRSKAQQVFSSLTASVNGFNCIEACICPIHKKPLDLMFAGYGGSEHWCPQKGCKVKVRFNSNDEFEFISGVAK